ncbi:hypothetical protein PTKIN_Ptkin04bG0141600 [Pterospermum kingtungense]
MEALKFLRFWKPSYGSHKENQNQPCIGNSCTTEIPKSMAVSDPELDEGEDSFIDLELSLHGFDDKGNVHCDSHEENCVKGKKRFESEEQAVHEPAKIVGDKELDLPKQARSLSPNDHFSKRKIIPIELSSKPQSPIALLKSAPKFRVFTLRKSKSVANTSNTYIGEKTELIGISMGTPKHEKQGSSSKHFKVKFQIEESSNLPIFTRESSLRKTKAKAEDSLPDDSSRRLSKDLIQKSLNIIKPLYVKVSKKNIQSDKTKILSDVSMASPAASPAATVYSVKGKQGNLSTGVRGVCKHLGKSRSASATSSPISRRDDSLLLQHDGIQSAILHCKKSFNSSRESSWLSRCTSDSSQEKLSNASSTGILFHNLSK